MTPTTSSAEAASGADLDVARLSRLRRMKALALGLLVLASAGLAAVGLLVQRWCRLDDERDRDPSDPRFGSDDSRYR